MDRINKKIVSMYLRLSIDEKNKSKKLSGQTMILNEYLHKICHIKPFIKFPIYIIRKEDRANDIKFANYLKSCSYLANLSRW